MKVTDPNVIRTGEKELIDAVKQDLDWDAVKEIIRKRISMRSLKAKDGEIIVHNNKIAFRIDLELNMPVSLMFDRDGNYISEKESDAELPGEDSALVLEEENTMSEKSALVLGEEDTMSEESALVLDEENTMSEKSALVSGEEDAVSEKSALVLGEEDAVSEDSALVLGEEDTLSEDSALVLDEEDTMSEEFASVSEADGLVTADQMDESLSDADSADDAEKVENTFLNADEDLGELDLSDFEDEDLDEDLDDILKESREFWEQKKEE